MGQESNTETKLKSQLSSLSPASLHPVFCFFCLLSSWYWMLTKLIMVIILQHIHISNHYVLYLKLRQYYMSIISQWKKKKKDGFSFPLTIYYPKSSLHYSGSCSTCRNIISKQWTEYHTWIHLLHIRSFICLQSFLLQPLGSLGGHLGYAFFFQPSLMQELSEPNRPLTSLSDFFVRISFHGNPKEIPLSTNRNRLYQE